MKHCLKCDAFDYSIAVGVMLGVCVRCRYVIMELIDTEKDYVRDLGFIVEVSNSIAAFLAERNCAVKN